MSQIVICRVEPDGILRPIGKQLLPKRPRSKVWRRARPREARGTHEGVGQHWRHRRRRLLVISQLSDLELPGSGGQVGPTWHVSASRDGKRCSLRDMAVVRVAFGMGEAEEDNHHPGIARHLFLPVAKRWRNECECKTNETVITEPDGYRWTNPTDAPCRGCELEQLTGAPCTLHRT